MMLLRNLTHRFSKDFKKVSLRQVLVVPFVLQIFAAVGLTGWLSFRNGQKAVNDVATQLRGEVTERIKQHLNNYLATPHLINKINIDIIQAGILNLQDLPTLEQHFWRQMQLFNSVGLISFVNKEGECVGIERLDNGKLQINIVDKSHPNNLRLYGTNDRGDRISSEEVIPNFDPRTRPGYVAGVQAGKPTWTRIFTYQGVPRLAVSAVAPVTDKRGNFRGVVVTDILLSLVSNFLHDLKVGQSGQTFILERNGMLVASSTLPQPFLIKDGKPERIKASSSSDPLIRSTVQDLTAHFGDLTKIDTPQQLNFEIEGKRQFLQVTPLKDERGINWLIVVAVPEADFMEQIHSSTRTTIILCVLALLVSTAIGIFTSRWITMPILSLGEASRAIARGELDKKVEVEGLRELEVLASSFNLMATQLQESFAALENTNQELETRVQERTAALLHSEEKFSKAFCSSPNPSTITRLTDGCHIEANEIFCRLTGYARDEVIGHTATELNIWVNQEDRHQLFQMLSTDGSVCNYEFEFRTKLGEVRTGLLSAEIIIIGGQECLLSLSNDITDRKKAEEALRQSEERWQLALRGTGDGIWDWNLKTNEIFYSTRWKKILAYSDDEIANHLDEYTTRIHPDELDWVMHAVQEHLDKTTPYFALEHRLRCKDGTYKWILSRGQALWDEARVPVRMVGSIVDISDRKQAEEALRTYKFVVDKASIQIIWMDESGRFHYANSAACNSLGYSSEELSAMRVMDIAPDFPASVWSAHWQKFKQLKTSSVLESQHRAKDGRIYPVEVNPVFIEFEGQEYIVAFIQDISDRKAAEIVISQSERKYRNLVETSQDMIWSLDSESRYTFVNQAVKQIHGYEPFEMIGCHFTDFLPPEQIDKVQAAFSLILSGNESDFQYEAVNIRKDGRHIHLMFNALVLRDLQGNVLGATGTASDITYRVQREQALRLIVEGTASTTGSEFFRSIVRYLALVLQVRCALVTEFANPAKTRVHTLAFWTGIDFSENIEYDIANTPFEKVLKGKNCHYSEGVQAIFPEDPYLVEVGAESFLGIPLVDSSGNILGHLAVMDVKPIGNDQTLELILKIFAARAGAELERKLAEDALIESAKRERAIARVIERMRQTLDIEKIFSATTEELRQILKCDRVVIYRFYPDWSGEFVSESVGEGWLLLVGSDIKTVWLDSYLRETEGGRYRNHKNLAVDDIYQRDYSLCYIELLEKFQVKAYCVVPVFSGEKLWGLVGAYQNNGPRHWQRGEVRLLAQIGTQLGVALQQAELLSQTQTQSAELKKAAYAADAANRSKSEFLANMSHELRTPLNAILGFTQLMTRDNSLNPEQQKYLKIINTSGEHLLELINDILDMSKIEAGRTSLNENSFDLYRLLDTLEDMLQIKTQSQGLQLIFERAPDVPQYVQTDESKLRQVLINLLGNAIKFTESGGVTLRVAYQHQKLVFEIEDTGPGISPSELGILFEPFVQTEAGRKSQTGTGLGLPISRKFVQMMGGEIFVSSNLNQGTIFRFWIEISLAEASQVQTASAKGRAIALAPDQPRYRILAVDDRMESRLLLVKLLASVGFEVREAENGREAVAIWESWQPQLIWMDMRMPVMDGYEATQQIKAHLKGQRTIIIALTASALEEDRTVVLSAGCDDFVRKPFREEVIFEKMAEYLGVRYIYEQPSKSTTLAEGGKSDSFFILHPSSFQEALAVMPAEWLAQLHQAALSGRDKLMLQLIEQIPSTHSFLAQALAEKIDSFEFEEIMNLTQTLIK